MYAISINHRNVNTQKVDGRRFASVVDAFEFAHEKALALSCLAYVVDEDGEIVDRVDGRG